MGFDMNGIQCVLYAKSLGLDFTRTATIGRQEMHVNPSEFKELLKRFSFAFDDATVDDVFGGKEGHGAFAEKFLRFLGAEEVHSFDVSGYEGSTHVHDFNSCIPDIHKQQYNMVIDGGTLEHVFNFPVAISNCMEMLAVGGHYIGITPANNFFGHGFYQFSPELYFSIFNAANGFEMIRVIAFEDDPETEWFSVANPASTKSRVTLINDNPVYLFVIARRVENRLPFQSMPYQSDYVAGSPWSWNRRNARPEADGNDGESVPRRGNRVLECAVKLIPHKASLFLKFLLRHNRGFHPSHFHPIKLHNG
jgi:hypothetical protein